MKASSDMGAAADHLDQVVRAGEDASLVVGRQFADVLLEERVLDESPIRELGLEWTVAGSLRL